MGQRIHPGKSAVIHDDRRAGGLDDLDADLAVVRDGDFGGGLGRVVQTEAPVASRWFRSQPADGGRPGPAGRGG